jgi:hypothetical protein
LYLLGNVAEIVLLCFCGLIGVCRFCGPAGHSFLDGPAWSVSFAGGARLGMNKVALGLVGHRIPVAGPCGGGRRKFALRWPHAVPETGARFILEDQFALAAMRVPAWVSGGGQVRIFGGRHQRRY